MKFYIAVDCEGPACVVGEPGKGLGSGENYRFACLQATREANAAARALFDAGAQEVVVWDAHGTGVNLQYDLLDPRCRILLGSGHRGRFAGMDKKLYRRAVHRLSCAGKHLPGRVGPHLLFHRVPIL